MSVGSMAVNLCKAGTVHPHAGLVDSNGDLRKHVSSEVVDEVLFPGGGDATWRGWLLHAAVVVADCCQEVKEGIDIFTGSLLALSDQARVHSAWKLSFDVSGQGVSGIPRVDVCSLHYPAGSQHSRVALDLVFYLAKVNRAHSLQQESTEFWKGRCKFFAEGFQRSHKFVPSSVDWRVRVRVRVVFRVSV